MTTHAHANAHVPEAALPFQPDAHEALAVVRHMGKIQYLLSDRENWILDEHHADRFLAASDVRRVDPARLRSELVTRFPDAQSWWDVETLFPIAFVDFDSRRLAAFYPEGPHLERYVPAGWSGEFVDFASSDPADVFPEAAKFWIVDGHDLLRALIERGRHGGTA